MKSKAKSYLLCGLLRHSAARTPDKTGLSDGDRSLSFAEMDRKARTLAAHLQGAGVTPGDRVVLFMSNSIEFVLAFWGAIYSGAVVVPVNAETKEGKLSWILEDCRPAAALADAELFGVLQEAAQGLPMHLAVGAGRLEDPSVPQLADSLGSSPVAPDCLSENLDQNLAVIVYTSGSTGLPKGVMLSHLNVLSAARSVAEYLEYRSTDKVFCAVPFTFDYGMHQITMTALVGAELFVERSFSKPFFALHKLVKAQATVLPLVPTMVSLIEPLARRFDLSCVRTVTNTAAALSLRQIDLLRGMFSKARVFSMYGLTECHRCTYLPPALLDSHPGSVGKAIPNTELWVVDDEGTRHFRNATGELVIRGSTVMKGYWQNPEQTNRKLKPGPMPGELVLHTGDICRLDEDGLLYFVARKDDVLKVRGEKVAPREVEDIILAHPAVRHAAVLGEDDPVLGQRIVAFAELNDPGAQDGIDLTAWCAERLESYMVPSQIHFLPELPRNENGKIDKLALRIVASEPAMRRAKTRLHTPSTDVSLCPINASARSLEETANA